MSFQIFHIATIGEKNRQVCPHQSVAKIAGDQIRRDQRIKSPGVSLALRELTHYARFSPPIDADTLRDFFSPIAEMWHFNLVPRLYRIAAVRYFEKSGDKIVHPD